MLQKLTNWLREQLLALWEAFSKFMSDLFLTWLEHQLNMIVWMFSHIPTPEVLTQQSLGSLLGNAGPSVSWAIGVFQLGPSAAVISAAMVFFIVRRILTLGIW
ncbi:phage coat protein [Pseudoxanthomonas beigongshangi]